MDPLAEDAPDWTPYRYCFNNPINYTDPDGMFEDEASAKKHADDNNIKTSWFSRVFGNGSKIVENKVDGEKSTWSIDNKKEGSSIFQDKTLANEANPDGIFTGSLITGENNQSPASSMAISAGVVSQYDSPALGPADVVAAGMLLYSGYLVLNPPNIITTMPDPGVVFSKKASDASKNEAHGDGGRAASKAEKQIEQLREQLKSATGKTKDIIKKKIENITKDAAKKKKRRESQSNNKKINDTTEYYIKIWS